MGLRRAKDRSKRACINSLIFKNQPVIQRSFVRELVNVRTMSFPLIAPQL